MEANKENERTKGTSNIPVLIRSLPKSGRPLTRTEQLRTSKENPTRDPLKTITSQCVNQDSTGTNQKRAGLSVKVQETSKKRIPPGTLKTVYTQRLIEKLDGLRNTHRPKNIQVPQQKINSQCDSVNRNNNCAIQGLNGPLCVSEQASKIINNDKIQEVSKTDVNSLRTINAQCLNRNLAGPSQIPKYIYSDKNKEDFPLSNAKANNQFLKQDSSGLKDQVNKTSHICNEKCRDNLNVRQESLKIYTDKTVNKDLAGSSLEVVTQESNIYIETNKKICDKAVPLRHSWTAVTSFVNSDLAGTSQNEAPAIIDKQTTNGGKIVTNTKDKLLGAVLKPSTSFFTPPLELLGSVKKVKRSLKRPHSRGLQSLPPIDINFKNDVVRHNFTKTEVNAHEFHNGAIIDELTKHYTIDALKYLLRIEKKPIGSNISERHRSCMVNYILQVNGSRGNPAVAQSACWYLDSCVIDSPRTLDQLKLTAAACFWIANKFHGGAIHGMRMVRRAQFCFSVNDLATAEKSILRELNFPTQPTVPHEFVPYLCWVCNDTNSELIESAAAFLCQCGLTVSKALGQEYASVVAAAAVKTALELLRMEAELKKLEECSIYQAAKSKAMDMSATCSDLRNAVLTMVSVNYDYKSALFQFSVAPHYIAPKLMCAAHYDVDNEY